MAEVEVEALATEETAAAAGWVKLVRAGEAKAEAVAMAAATVEAMAVAATAAEATEWRRRRRAERGWRRRGRRARWLWVSTYLLRAQVQVLVQCTLFTRR